MALSTVEREIAHLFRRAGFGATRADIATWAPKGRAAAVDFLVDYDKVDNSAVNAEADSIDPPNNPDQIARWWATFTKLGFVAAGTVPAPVPGGTGPQPAPPIGSPGRAGLTPRGVVPGIASR